MELVHSPTFTRGHQCVADVAKLLYEFALAKLLDASDLAETMKLKRVRWMTVRLGLTPLEVTPLNGKCSIKIASNSGQQI